MMPANAAYWELVEAGVIEHRMARYLGNYRELMAPPIPPPPTPAPPPPVLAPEPETPPLLRSSLRQPFRSTRSRQFELTKIDQKKKKRQERIKGLPRSTWEALNRAYSAELERWKRVGGTHPAHQKRFAPLERSISDGPARASAVAPAATTSVAPPDSNPSSGTTASGPAPAPPQ